MTPSAYFKFSDQGWYWKFPVPARQRLPLRPVVPEASVTVASSWESTAFMCWRSKEGTRAPRGGSAGNAGRSWSRETFTIGGNAPDLFYPGTSEPLDLAITNPFKFAIKVLSVSVTVEPVPAKNGAPDPACPAATNLLVTRPLGATLAVPALSD